MQCATVLSNALKPSSRPALTLTVGIWFVLLELASKLNDYTCGVSVPSISIMYPEQHRRLPLGVAANLGDLLMVRLLLDANAKIDSGVQVSYALERYTYPSTQRPLHFSF